MYSFIIVDDDKLVRERILSLIPQAQLELELGGEAENGVQALELFQNVHPQIVLMDLNIPLLDGLEVANLMLQEDPDVNVIIITGHGSLTTAQAAIRSGVVDFLLKPVDQSELCDILRKVVQKLQSAQAAALEQQRMDRLLERGMPLLRSRFFLSLIRKEADELDEADCREHLADFGISENVSNICVTLIVPNNEARAISTQISMQSILEEELEKRLEMVDIGCLFCYDVMQRLILVVYGNHRQFGSVLEEKLSAIRDKMRYVHRMDFCASIGSMVSNFCHLRTSYLDAERALGYRNIFGNNNIVNSATVKNIEVPSTQSPTMSYNEIMDLLVTENIEQIRSGVDQYLSRLSYLPQSSLAFIRQKAIELLALLLNCANELGLDKELQDDKKTMLYVQLLSADHLWEIKRLILNTAEELVQGIHSKRKDSKARALSSAKQFVYKNYADPELNLAAVAESVSLSPNYVSQLFRRYDNCSFTEFLNHVRIEMAKKLLSTTHMRVYEVALAVGYQNSKYFFHLFKQVTGMRPKEFYESAIKNSP